MFAPLLLCTSPLLLALPGPAAPAQEGEPLATWSGYALSEQDTARFPYAARVADLDGDGELDAVAAHWPGPAALTVVLGDGQAGFGAPLVLPLPLPPLDVEVVDLDGDGRLDLVATLTGFNYEGTEVAVLRNLGGGSFAAPTFHASGSGPLGLVATDLDGDGNQDVVVSRYGFFGSGNTVAVLLGDGLGGLSAPSFFPCGAAPYRMDVADLDGDGDPDLVVAREDQVLSVLLNNGAGFAAPVEYDALTSFNNDVFPNVRLADVDLDGDVDIFYSSTLTSGPLQSAAAALLLNDGSGAFAPSATVLLDQLTIGDSAVWMDVADVTGDGWPDLIAARSVRGWSVVPGSPSGFGTPTRYFGGNQTFGVFARDVDDDGLLDVLSIGRDSLQIDVHRNLGGGLYPAPPQSPAEFAANSLAAGDVDGDGDLDLALAAGFGNTGVTKILRNDGGSTFVGTNSMSSGGPASRVKLADLDGDLDLDLLWTRDLPPYDFSFRRNDGLGAFGAVETVPVGTCGSGEAFPVDLDGDGDNDVILTEFGGGPGCFPPKFFVSSNLGDGSFAPPVAVQTIGRPFHVAPGDFNGDGRVDVAMTTAIQVEIVLALPGGGFGPSTPIPADAGALRIAADDLNGDGLLDLVTANSGSQGVVGSQGESVSVLLGNGDGTFAPSLDYPGSYSPIIINEDGLSLVDLDGDGDLDVVVGNLGSNDASVWKNRGDGTLEPRIRYGIGREPVDVIVADVTGDQRPDLVGLASSADIIGLNKSVAVVANRGVDWQSGGFGAWPGALSAAEGGQQVWSVDAGAAAAGALYVVVGSLSGSNPGLPLAPGVVLPLVPDVYTNFTLAQANQGPFSASFGVLDGQGQAQAAIAAPAGALANLVGAELRHATVVFDPSLGPVAATNASPLVVTD